MVDKAIRLSPSGPDIVNSGGTPFAPGPGARMRMQDLSSVIGDGSVVIPTAKTTIKAAGFTGSDADALQLSMDLPKVGARYGMQLTFDVVNTSTNIDSTVDLYLEVSVDGGTTWTERASNQHHPSAAADLTTDVLSGRQVSLFVPLGLGSALGVVAGSPSIKVRAAAAQPTYLGGAGAELYSPLTDVSSATSKGTFYMRLEECF
jgi:hypothetical protein